MCNLPVTVEVHFNIRIQMARAGVKTLTELSELTGISRQALSRIDNGKARRVDLDTLGKLMTFFKCNIEDLFVVSEQPRLL